MHMYCFEDDQEAAFDRILEEGTCSDPQATLEGEDCGIVTTLATGSKMAADPKATAWREPEATLVSPVCVAVTELAAGTSGIITVALLEVGRGSTRSRRAGIWRRGLAISSKHDVLRENKTNKKI